MEKIYVNYNNINFTLLTNNINNMYFTNTVYQIIKSENKYYVGSSKRKLLQRIKEHTKDIINNNDIITVIVIKKNIKEKFLKSEEKKYIKYVANKILRRFHKTKNNYDNPFVFSCLKNNFLNKIL